MMYLSFLYILKKWMTRITWVNASNLLFPKLLSLFQELDRFKMQFTRKDCSAVLCDRSRETVFPGSSLSCFSLGFSILPSMKSGYKHNAVIFLQLIIQFSL